VDPITHVEYKPKLTKSEIDEIAASRRNFRLLYQIQVDSINMELSRTLVISGSVTLENLHKILCIALGWDEDSKYIVRCTFDHH
jgi:hypothetical protein